VVLEAINFGLPVVASEWGGLPEMVHNGKNGWLIDPRERAVAAEAITKILKDEKLRERMSKESRRISRQFGAGKYFARLEKIYQQVKDDYDQPNEISV
jgi:glycosyltransferase involved in cell wall biosynthesis